MYFPYCITCKYPLGETLRPLDTPGYCFCKVCEAAYRVVNTTDLLGHNIQYLEPLSPGRPEFSDSNNEQTYSGINSDSTFPPEFSSSNYNKIKPYQPEQNFNFDEERSIIDKSETVKDFLRNSEYLKKPYDKDE